MKTEAQRTLEQIAPLLGDAYSCWKEWEGKKNDYKDDFFLLADEALSRRGLAYKVAEVAAESESQARQRAELHNPGWRIEEIRVHRITPGAYEVVLAEDPSLKSYSYEHEGVKYARQVSKGAVMLDDEWLKDEDPELYEAVTYQLPWGDRIAIPVEHMPKELLGRLTTYLYNAKPRVSLAAPRAVKD